ERDEADRPGREQPLEERRVRVAPRLGRVRAEAIRREERALEVDAEDPRALGDHRHGPKGRDEILLGRADEGRQVRRHAGLEDRGLDAEPHAETALRMLPPAASRRVRAASASIPARSETIATFALPRASSSARFASSSEAPVAWRTIRRTRSRSFSFVACTST